MKPIIDQPSRRPVLGIIVLGILLAILILSWNNGDGKPSAAVTPERGHAGHAAGGDGFIAMSDEQVRLAGIALASAQAAHIGIRVQLPGEVTFNEDRTAHVVPRVSGVAESVQAGLGQEVKKGQVLAVISSPELADLRSNLLAAEKRLALAALTYEREQKLWQDRISAERDYLQARQAYQEAEIQAQTARSKLAALGADAGHGALNRYVLRAPFDGIVVEKHIAPGEAVKEDANVFLLSDLSSVWVQIAVPAADIDAVRVGAAADIQSGSTSATAAGKVGYLGSLLGEQTRSARARVVIANPHMAWRPGMFVNVAVAKGSKPAAVAVQADAIQALDGGTVVFTRAPNGFQARAVRTGATDGKLVEILDGLQPGESYAAAGSFVVKAEQGKGDAEHEH